MKIHFIIVLTYVYRYYVIVALRRNPVKWTEFSFILKPSPLGGIGIFATHDIPAGTDVFTRDFNLRSLKIKEVPEEFLRYCIYTSDEECLCPERFDRMEILWYINHSSEPNITPKGTIGENKFDISKRHDVYAIKDIRAGDEILIDYNYFGEPEQFKEDYFK
jgi:hypothetical protein